MIKLTDKMFIGSTQDYNLLRRNNSLDLICCANNPYSYNADAHYEINDAKSLSKVNVNECLRCIRDTQSRESKFLLFCDQGVSRSPTIGLITLMELGIFPKKDSSLYRFTEKVYQDYRPGKGMRELVLAYVSDKLW